MATKIGWTLETWNPVTGCNKISAGCDNCYALTMAGRLKRMGQARYQTDGDPRTSGPGFGVACHPDALGVPLKWRQPRRVFVNSMSDLFHKDVPDGFIANVFAVMAQTPRHTYQVLTKRPQRLVLLNDPGFIEAVQVAIDDMYDDPDDQYVQPGPWPLANVWLGVSIESDAYAWRADHLRAAPAAVRFVSAEPLLGPLPSLDLTGISWVIIGGESGPGARPMDLEWAREISDRCRNHICPNCGASFSIPLGMRCADHRPVRPSALFVKQLGTVAARELGLKSAGHDIDAPGFPADLKVREYPA